MRIVFMGTPDFAAASLRALISADRNVVGVVSQPDRPKGRGHKLAPTDVKVVAEECGLPVYQPEKIKNGELLPILEELKPDVIIVVAYGKILPDYVLNYPKYGCINVHASLLPKYRGAAPIQWAIINGEKVTGVTTMLMDKGVDTGDMLLKAETEIGENETAAELFDRLAVIGGELLIKTLDALEEGTLTPEKQNEEESTHAPLISRETGVIDWTKSAHEIACLIRGMNSWPMASTYYNGEPLKIATAEMSDEVREVSSVLESDEMRKLSSALASDEMRKLSSALASDEMRALSSVLESDEMRALSSALASDEMRTLSSALASDEMRKLSSALANDDMRELSSALVSDEIQELASDAATIAAQMGRAPGTILAIEKGKGMKIACGKGVLYVTEAQFSGSKRMNVEDYARGHKIETGLILGKEEG